MLLCSLPVPVPVPVLHFFSGAGIATDGYSPWSFVNAAAGQGDMPPYPTFSNVSSDGLVVTTGGGRFQLHSVHNTTAEAPVH